MKRVISLFCIFLFIYGLLGVETLEAAPNFMHKGYSFTIPVEYEKINGENDDVVLIFEGKQSKIKVFVQDLKDNLPASAYIEYGNKQLYLGKAGFKIIVDKNWWYKGYKVREIGYYRPKLKNLPVDQNYYREIHVINEKDKKVLTFWGKSSKDAYDQLTKDLRKVLESINTQNTSKSVNRPVKIVKTPFVTKPVTYSGNKIKLEILPGKKLWGRFYPGIPFNNYEKMKKSEIELNHNFEFLITYYLFPGKPFPEKDIKKVYDEDRVLMLALQPYSKDLEWIAVLEIIEGKYDQNIREWAQKLKELDEPVFIRLMNEMNGDWDPWCAWFYGKDTDLYIKAWRHIVNIFRDVGAKNVLFVWNPHDRSYPDFTWNNPHLYYPGDDYVDWVGLTGYNNGTSYPGDVWRGFDEIYRPLYLDYLLHYPDKPFMITEFSCNEIGGDKPLWIKKAMKSLAENYPNIKICVWFDKRDKLWQYELKSSHNAFEEFKKGLTYENFIKNAVTKILSTT